jgi:hypothetical protein
MPYLVDLIHYFRSQSKDLKSVLMVSNILEQESLTWSIWLVLKESPKLVQLETD